MPYLCKECFNLRFACLDAALEGSGLAAAPTVQPGIHSLAQFSRISGFADNANAVTGIIGAGIYDGCLRFFGDGVRQFPHTAGI